MQISISENAKIKEKTIYSESEKSIINIFAHFLHFIMAIFVTRLWDPLCPVKD